MDSKQPFFSICIPNYNYAHYIGETIESVLSQTFHDFEIVIQDNASTDNSWEVIQDYAKKDSRVRIFKNKSNIGFAPNLNRAVINSKGNFIILLSSDDLMINNSLAKYSNLIKNSNVDKENIVLCSNAFIIDEHSKVSGIIKKVQNFSSVKTLKLGNFDSYSSTISIENIKGIDLLIDSLKQFNIPAIFCSTCFSRTIFDKVDGYDEGYYYCPDFGFLLKILSVNPDVFWLHESLFKYRKHQQNQVFNQVSSFNLLLEIDGVRSLTILKGKDVVLSRIPFKVIIKAYLKNVCIKNSFVYIIRSRYFHATRPIMFGMSNYPREILSIGLFYFCIFGILFFPISFVFF